jgi:benzoate 4-monooxygenase
MFSQHLFSVLDKVDLVSLAFLVPAVVLLAHFAPWFLDPHGIRSIPGPFLAKFSDAWLGWISAQGHRSEVVHEMHKKYGGFRSN